MKDYSGIMGGLYFLTEWFMKFTVVNFIWFVINIPTALVLVNTIMTDANRLMYALPLIVLVPVLFFPSTIAMFATVRDWIMKKEKMSLIKNYFHHFKSNYLKSLLSGFIWVIIWFVWLTDFVYFNKEGSVIAFIVLVIGMMLIVFNINYFSLSTHYHMKIKELFKNSFYVTIGSPLLFMIILFTQFTLLFLAISKFWFLFPLSIGSVSAFISFLAFYRFSLKIKSNQENNRE